MDECMGEGEREREDLRRCELQPMECAKVAISEDANVVQLKLPWHSFKAARESLELRTFEE